MSEEENNIEDLSAEQLDELIAKYENVLKKRGKYKVIKEKKIKKDKVYLKLEDVNLLDISETFEEFFKKINEQAVFHREKFDVMEDDSISVLSLDSHNMVYRVSMTLKRNVFVDRIAAFYRKLKRSEGEWFFLALPVQSGYFWYFDIISKEALQSFQQLDKPDKNKCIALTYLANAVSVSKTYI